MRSKTGKKQNMTDQQVLRYTQLCKRRMDILCTLVCLGCRNMRQSLKASIRNLKSCQRQKKQHTEREKRNSEHRAISQKRLTAQGERKESESIVEGENVEI